MKTYTYVATIKSAKEGGYTAMFPTLPGCITEGDTIEEVIYMAKDALAGYLETRKDLGWPIPKEKSSLLKKASTFYLPISVNVK
ncbi:MAG: type II toxin-antitoxin system HicB family antitoxin [Candidatus Paceibacterota bacterium]|jgi:predicted RNase H-like HicB family nuclease